MTYKVEKTTKSAGFTLIEMIITLAIAAILLAVAVPSLRESMQKNRTTAASNELTGSMNVARSESVKRGTRVVVCKSANNADCVTSNAAGYEQGWIIFVDSNNDAVRDAGEAILRVHEAVGGGVTMIGAGNDLDQYISYMPEGRALVKASATPQTGSIAVSACDTVAAENKNLMRVTNMQLKYSGRLSMSKGVCP